MYMNHSESLVKSHICSMVLGYLPTFARTTSHSFVGKISAPWFAYGFMDVVIPTQMTSDDPKGILGTGQARNARPLCLGDPQTKLYAPWVEALRDTGDGDVVSNENKLYTVGMVIINHPSN